MNAKIDARINKSFIKTILVIAIPIALQNLLLCLLNIFDQVLVGALPSDVADNAMSAVLLINQLMFVFQLLLFALLNTTNIFVSQYNGRGETKSMPPAVGFSFLVALVISGLATIFCAVFPSIAIGLFAPKQAIKSLAVEFLRVGAFSLLPFAVTIALTFPMRSIKKTRLALTANIIAIGLNLTLDYCLMFGKFGLPKMGLVGSAWGTTIARIVEMLIVLVGVLISRPPILAGIKQMTAFSLSYMKRFIKAFIPILANEVFWVLGTSVYLTVFAQLPDSENILAAVNVAQTLEKLLSVAMIGLGAACGISIGNILGRKDTEGATNFAHKSIRFACILGAIVAFATFGLSFFAPKLFVNLTPLSHEYAASLLRILALSSIVKAVNFTMLIGIMRPGGDTKYILFMETATIWLIGVPVTMLLGLVFKLNFRLLYIGIIGEQIVKAIFCYVRISRGKWLKMLVPQENTFTLPLTVMD